MLNGTRRSILLGIALVFFFNTCLFGVLFTGELYFHKLEQLQNLSQRNGQTLTMVIASSIVDGSTDEFHWKKDWEFEYKGEMYDVVTSEKSGDKYVFVVKHDRKEEKILRKAKRQAEHERKQRQAEAKKNLKVNLVYTGLVKFDFSNNQSTERNIPQRQPVICESHRTLPDPPPWIG
jgi:hypothetical protein